jgi:ArsR family transcriptional regulator, arsenate/arsenite/antimonite-responsive transcriptional repressor
MHPSLQMIHTFVKTHLFWYHSAMRQKSRLQALFRALADPTRLRFINLMAGGELCVCYFVEVIDAPQPKISRHLAYLRRAGIVATRREGKWMHYRLVTPADPHAAAILKKTLEALKDDKELQRDSHRLTRACCGPASLVELLGAPVPAFS